MSYLNKSQILNAADMGFEDVEVPEWGGTVRVKVMNGAERDAFEASMITLRGSGKATMNLINMRAKLAARCLVDDNGALIFGDEDIAVLGRKSASALDRVVAVAKRLNRMDDNDLREMADGLKNAQPAALPID
jgi:hypothetical protein